MNCILLYKKVTNHKLIPQGSVAYFRQYIHKWFSAFWNIELLSFTVDLLESQFWEYLSLNNPARILPKISDEDIHPWLQIQDSCIKHSAIFMLIGVLRGGYFTVFMTGWPFNMLDIGKGAIFKVGWGQWRRKGQCPWAHWQCGRRGRRKGQNKILSRN